MVRKLLGVVAFLVTSLSIGQTTTYTISSDAADQLVVSSNGYFLNKDGGGAFTTATVTITCVTDFGDQTTLDTFDNYNTFWLPIKDAANANYFAVSGGLKDSNTASDNTVGFVRTRTWELTQIAVSTASPAAADGDSGTVKSSGGQARDGSNTNLGSITRFANFAIDIVASYSAPVSDYLTISNVQSTLATVTRGGEFTITFDYSTNVDVENMGVTLYMHTSTTGYTLATAAPQVIVPTISVPSEVTDQAGSVVLTFTTEETLEATTGGPYTFNVEPSADLTSPDKYMLRFYRDTTDGNKKFSNGAGTSQFIFSDLTITTIEDETLSSGGVKNSLNVYPNPTTGVINIPDVSGIVNIQVVNVLGQVVKTVKAANQIDISDVNAGVYILVSDNGKQFKVVKK
ncbi:T9SS type A sorting domain-containing protein [Wenyingzhuangia sp. IMCC45574]